MPLLSRTVIPASARGYPATREISTKGENGMNQDNRVLARIQARDLTESEIQAVAGGQIVHTLTICTVPNASAFGKDGDVGEC